MGLRASVNDVTVAFRWPSDEILVMRRFDRWLVLVQLVLQAHLREGLNKISVLISYQVTDLGHLCKRAQLKFSPKRRNNAQIQQ